MMSKEKKYQVVYQVAGQDKAFKNLGDAVKAGGNLFGMPHIIRVEYHPRYELGYVFTLNNKYQ